jgi:hypothetical protein
MKRGFQHQLVILIVGECQDQEYEGDYDKN